MSSNVSRREVLQGMAATAATAMVSQDTWGATHRKNQAAWPQPTPGTETGWQPFSEDWRFRRGDLPSADGAVFDDAAWRSLDLPHDWSIEDLPPSPPEQQSAVWIDGDTPLAVGPFSLYESAGQTATGWTVGGVGWYRKTFSRPNLLPGGKVELRFEGVYMNSDVWLNGVRLGNHPYGYTEFIYDLTPHLTEGENRLAVRVNNTGRNSRWYAGSGMYRKVWLQTSGELRIAPYGVLVTTEEASQAAARLKVVVTVENAGPRSSQARVRARLLDADGNTAAETEGRVAVPGRGQASATCALSLKTPRLWSPNSPSLYRAEVVLEGDGKVADATELAVGVRRVEIDAQHGLLINGESVKLYGGCMHQDNGPLGAVCIPRAEERRVEILKANGFNAVRTSHNPPSRAFLDACDRHGVLVIDEAFDGWEVQKNPQDYHLYFKDWWQRDVENMILRDRNHACVILWSIGNEMNERAEPRGLEIGKALRDYIHQLEPTRKVTAAICGPYDHPKQTWQNMQPAFTYLDVGGYNYLWKEYGNDHAKYPQRVMVGTESYPAEAYENWRTIDSSPWVLGDFIWTAFDYIGEAGVGRTSVRNGPGFAGGLAAYPWFDAYCGDFDITGEKKAISYYRDVVWRRSKIEMAVQRPVPAGYTEHPSPWGWSDELRSWTWPGHEGQPLTVRVYTRAQRVALFLNGKQIDAKELAEKDALKAEFSVPYAEGELKAVAYADGAEIGSLAFTTAGKAHRLVLTPDRPQLKASRDDLSYVRVTVVDEGGRFVPDAVVPVSFELSGPGTIAGAGNGNPKGIASFQQPRHKTFHGTCTVILRPNAGEGTMELQASSPGLESAIVRVPVLGTKS